MFKNHETHLQKLENICNLNHTELNNLFNKKIQLNNSTESF